MLLCLLFRIVRSSYLDSTNGQNRYCRTYLLLTKLVSSGATKLVSSGATKLVSSGATKLVSSGATKSLNLR